MPSSAVRRFANDAGSGIVHFEFSAPLEWHLMIGNDPAYLTKDTGCDTCRYIFTKVMPGQHLSDAVPEGSYRQLSDLLTNLTSLPDDMILAKIGSVLPRGDYSVLLSFFAPELVVPGGEDDYFSEEAVATWGLDPYFGIGHCPQTPYYRLAERDLGAVEYGGKRLGVALAVPLFPPTLMSRQGAVQDYRAALGEGRMSPTVLAIGLVDDRGPAVWSEPAPIYSRHLIVTLYVLDGHHKLLAAADERAHIQILSFFPRSIERLVDAEMVDRGIEMLTRSEAPAQLERTTLT